VRDLWLGAQRGLPGRSIEYVFHGSDILRIATAADAHIRRETP